MDFKFLNRICQKDIYGNIEMCRKHMTCFTFLGWYFLHLFFSDYCKTINNVTIRLPVVQIIDTDCSTIASTSLMILSSKKNKLKQIIVIAPDELINPRKH